MAARSSASFSSGSTRAESAGFAYVATPAAQQQDAQARAGAQLDRLARKRAVVRCQTYAQALADVLADPVNKELAHVYATGVKLPTGVRLNPGQVYDAVTKEANALLRYGRGVASRADIPPREGEPVSTLTH